MLEDITIRKGSFEEVLKIGNQIPEFSDPISIDDYRERINDHLSLILVANDKDIPVGFKIGYDRWEDGSFYSWLGGVLPAYRNQGIARNLATMQENWVKLKGFNRVVIKTRNRFRAMIQFLLKTDYKLIKVEPQEDIRENRLIFEKTLI